MLTGYLKTMFQSRDHKDIMLKGLYLSSIVIFLFLGLVSLAMGYESIFWIKMLLVILNAVFFYSYLKYGNMLLHVILLIIVVEIDSAYVLLGQHFNDFVTIYPFFIIFGFFFFFKLKAAVWLTLVHLLYWVVVSEYGHTLFPDDPTFQVISMANIAVCSSIATLFAYFYYVSIEMTYEKLEHANRQKAILLKEIHHRIKNNLNKTSSLIGLQMMSVESGKEANVKEVLRKSKLRIEAMAMVHDALYRTEDLEQINFEVYMQTLTQHINQAYETHVPVSVSAGDLEFPLETMMKIGLITNELLTNSIKHASGIENDTSGIVIDLTQEAEVYTMQYLQRSDEVYDIERLKTNDTLGMKLIALTVQEMDGTMDIVNDGGLKFIISFPA